MLAALAFHRSKVALVTATLFTAACAASTPAAAPSTSRTPPPARAAQGPPPKPSLPPAASTALERLKIPREAIAVVVRHPLTGEDRLSLQADRPTNPASIIKLLTTFAALERLGPSWTWRTPVWLGGRITGSAPDAVLEGDLHIKGSGDPKLHTDRLWTLLQRVRALGITEIRGDIVLDQSAFEAPRERPGDFDGEPLKPYNVLPRALLLNQRTVSYAFVPDRAVGVARVTVEPALAGLKVDATIPLSPGPCQDWRGDVKAQLADPHRVRFTGRYPASCGERQWHVAYSDPSSYDQRMIEAMWQGMGGRLSGRVREGLAPKVEPSFEWSSSPLADIVRDINRHSNNTMAQMLALTLAAQDNPNGTPVGAEQARRWLQDWAQTRLSGARPQGKAGSAVTEEMSLERDPPIIDNGSGLSRDQRISAHQVAQLLQHAWSSPLLPEFIGSLPVTGAPDGTLRRWSHLAGQAHLKTGSLRDVVGVAGYVLGRSGQRWIVVVMIQHERAQEARPVLDALVQWAVADGPPILRSSPRRGSP